jgi:putative ABC transport system ATP-binding protein
MSHELRTPLNALLGFVQLMDRDKHRSSDDRESLDIIHRSGVHLLGLINDVLSIAKIEAGKITLVDEPFDFRLLLHSVEEMMQARADAKGLALEVDLDENLPDAVRGDEGKLRQVLVNLLGNAVKFTSQGLVVLRIRWDEGAGRAFFEIEDTGVLTAGENVEFVMKLLGYSQKDCDKRTRELLDAVGLADRIKSRPGKLSGGQQQRVAVARSLASKPKFVLADEPTANLDSHAAEILLEIMENLNKNEGITFIFSTHDPRIMKRAKRIVSLEDGLVFSDVCQ